jgi:RNA polymerase primary sigma factor
MRLLNWSVGLIFILGMIAPVIADDIKAAACKSIVSATAKEKPRTKRDRSHEIGQFKRLEQLESQLLNELGANETTHLTREQRVRLILTTTDQALKDTSAWNEWQNLRDQVVKENLGLIGSFLSPEKNARIYDDLYSESLISLNDSVSSFDLSYDVSFAHYALEQMRKHVSKKIAVYLADAHQTAGIVVLGRQTDLILADFYTRNGRPPTDEEASALLGIQPEAVWNRRQRARRATSLSTPLPRTKDMTAGDRIEAPPREASDRDQSEGQEYVNFLISKLPERDQRVLRLFYGFELVEGRRLIQDEIGKVLGVSGSRIGQIREAALMKLREMMEQPMSPSAPSTPQSSN